MAFNVPNAIAYGDTIASLEQAEPDSLDFQHLGDRRNVVISGGEVTVASASGSYVSVALTATEVVIAANYGTIATNSGSPLLIAVPTTGQARFDLVCAKYDTGVLSFAIVQGTNSVSNPVYPALPANHLPLYAVFVKTGLNTGVLSRVIVDKRTFVGPSVYKTGTADPSGGQSGDLYLKTVSPTSGKSSLWVNRAGTWENIGGYIASSTTANSTLVLRDASGNFTAGTITANLTGNVSGTAGGVTWTNVTSRPEVGNVFIRTTDPLAGDGANGDVWIKVIA